MKDRVLLLLYIAAVVAITCVHDVWLLLAGVGVALVLAGRDAWRIARRAALAVLLFNTVVSLSYLILAGFQGTLSWGFLALLNTRVFLLTYAAFLLIRRINPFRALAFSRTLGFLLTLAYGQIMTFRRLLADFRLALRSRSLVRPGLRDVYRHGAATAGFFFGKSLRDTIEITQAMSSRGFFHDQG